MPKDTTDDVALSRRSLKAGVWYTVAKLAEEAEMDGIKCAVSEHFVAALTEFVFQKTLSLAKDLERFANHAGRTAIMIDDVKYEAICTEALQRGLGLKDLKTIARPVAARGSVTKRTASTKLASTSKAKSNAVAQTKGRVPAKAKVTASKVGGTRKGKEKERLRDSDDDEGESLGEEDSDDPRLESRRGSSEDEEGDEDDDDSLLDSDDSEPVKKKKKVVKKGSDGGSTKGKGKAKAVMVKKR
ncbi:BZ3500_MvSof-1268-A1-R1_Chr1-3g01853 [Microbotryum saponariae]|uniref:BZ3500_MvSof-1268-A1-R1_Chr1-3g01853 protein n=1 Tax=Microbotryum saponariae TaxID=289078 RepID=A0A2X0KCZ3_9BASI|nr:BZ3500_MvSof-1268-A1-R1_Chr1-3g01853 [Microbotryum saponariae]SCZ94742.1 BZ3501_MvSof-1269-A2-R1_Chr1-3g01455 [Microbotryum saponariae]